MQQVGVGCCLCTWGEQTGRLPQATQMRLPVVLCPQSVERLKRPWKSLLGEPSRPVLHPGTVAWPLQQSQILVFYQWSCSLPGMLLSESPQWTEYPQFSTTGTTWSPNYISVCVDWRPLHKLRPHDPRRRELPAAISLGLTSHSTSGRGLPTPCLLPLSSLFVFIKFQSSYISTGFSSWLLWSEHVHGASSFLIG